MEDITLMTKVLQPQRREDVLTRQRLLDRLYDMIDYKAVLLSAPAGYGKTTLLVDFAVDLEHSMCWYSLDASDRDPRVFIERLIYSIQHRFPNFGASTLQFLSQNPSLQQGAPSVIKMLVNEMVREIPEWFVLVLDDYHHLGEHTEDIDLLVSNFLSYQTDQCLTIIASRSVPDLPLIIQLVAKGGIGGLGLEELRFTAEEIQLLFQQNYQIELTAGQATELAQSSEGWITGILLSANTMWQSVLRNLMRARSSHQPVYAYLAQEVFSQQLPELQEFLLTSSTLVEFTAESCSDILDLRDAEYVLETIEDHNLFILALENGWYRYHNLFRAYLQDRLKRQDHDRWYALHTQAAGWYATHNHLEEAVQHYITIKDHQKAAETMAKLVQGLLAGGRFDTLLNWWDVIPKEISVHSPRLLLYQSRAASHMGRWDDALEMIVLAEQGYRSLNDTEGTAYAVLQRCQVWQNQGRYEDTLALSLELLLTIKEARIPVEYEVYHVIGNAYLAIGSLEEAAENYREAISYVVKQGNKIDQATIQNGYGNVLWHLGERTGAIQACEQALQTTRNLEYPAALASQLNDLGFYMYSLGQFRDAFRLFQEALLRARQAGLRRTEAFVLVSLGELSRDLGDFDRAEEFSMEGLKLAQTLGDPYLSAYTYESLGLIQRGLHNYPVAISTINRAIESAEEQKSLYQLGRYEASLGVVWADAGDPGRGLTVLAMACERLENLNATTELYRARLFRAWASFLRGDIATAETLLDNTLLEVDAAYAALVVREGMLMLPLLMHFAEQANKGAAIHKIIKQVQALPELARDLMQPVGPQTVETMRLYRVKGFGGSEIDYQGQQVQPTEWGAVTSRHLLYYMLHYESRTRDQIFEAFWPELNARRAKAAFHTTKFRVNRALGQDAFFFDGQYYTLDPDFHYWFDATEFERLLHQFGTTRRVEDLQSALDLYTGDFLPDCYMDWCDEVRNHLRERCLDGFDELAERLLQRRQYRQAADALQRALTIDPLRERFHQNLMRAYAQSGRRSQALTQFQRCEELFRTEMGIAVSQRTRDLYRKITEGQSLN